MKKNKDKILEIHAVEEEFGVAEDFVVELLTDGVSSSSIISQVKTVFDALFHSILLQGYDEDTVLQISSDSKLGSVDLVVGFEGKRFDPTVEDDDLSLEAKILEGYSDKISYSYLSGYNTIHVSARKGPTQSFAFCMIGMALAIVSFFFIDPNVSPVKQIVLLDGYVVPLEQLFTNAMLMLGAPVTLFSLLKNTTDTYIIAKGNSVARRMQRKSIITSVVAILLGLGAGMVISAMFGETLGTHLVEEASGASWSFKKFVEPIVPSSVIAPFEDISPFPLIVVSTLITYAMSTVGHYFDSLKRGIDICYALFSRMLHAVMAMLPFACFLSFLGILLLGGFQSLLYVAEYILFAVASCSVLVLTYIIRLKLIGASVVDTFKKLPSLIRENYKIGSTIDAVPFNIRYCTRFFGMSRPLLERCLPVLAQTNLDGNCFLIMLIAVMYFIGPADSISWMTVFVIAVLVLFLSLGAPNQPGSILIGSLIIISYLGSYEMLSAAIYLEVFLGGIQNMINVISALLIVAEEEHRHG